MAARRSDNKTGFSVRVKGLPELDRALGKADKGLRKNLRDSLRDVAGEVAAEARGIAAQKGLRDSGDLIAGIRPYALTGRSGVRSNAQHRGYAYPRRLEFEDRSGSSWGPRASLNPAVQAKQGDISRGIERLLDNLEDDFRGGSLL
jgi:hypothetical protein